MFTFDTAVDAYVNQSKAVLAHVQPEKARESLTALVDAQAAFARSAAAQVKTATDMAVKAAQDAAKTDWTKFFVASK